MSKFLAELLDEPEVVVESVIKKLEHLSGWESTDVRLLSEINTKVRSKISDLGLDPDDTTGPELFHALRTKLEHDEHNLWLNSDEIINKISESHSGYKVYALKRSIAKELLRKHPPRKLMKQLNYRSVDSLLKRENVSELYAVLFKIESSRWLNVFYKDLAKLTPSDFESQNIEIVKMPKTRWAAFSNTELTSQVTLLGAVAVWSDSVGNITLATNIAKAIGDLRATSALMKLKNVEANFGSSIAEIIRKQTEHPLKISVLPISWKTIFHHYGQRSASEHTEFFGPHILHEDIKSHNSIATLSGVSPLFSWWQELEFVAKKTEEGIVSFNLLDVISNQGKIFQQRNLEHFRKSLWHEFVNRYLGHPSVEQHFMQQIEPQTVPVYEYHPRKTAQESDIRQLIEMGV